MNKEVTFISKAEDKRLVYGVVYEPDVVDSQGDFAKAPTIEKAAHNFLKDYAIVKVMHEAQTQAEIVESYIAPVTFNMEDGQNIKKGSWVVAIKVDSDNLWDNIKSGNIRGLSMGGSGKRTVVDA